MVKGVASNPLFQIFLDPALTAACFFAAARFFAAAAGEPLLVLVSLSLSGVSLRLFGLLA